MKKKETLKFDKSAKSPHTIITKLITKSSTILDVGCSSGYLGRELTKKGVVCDGIDIEQSYLAKAKKYYRHLWRINLNHNKLPKVEQNYDYIIFADILEHLIEPDQVLVSFRNLLKQNGKIIVSLPNVARLEIRLKLLLGQFDYQPGILSQDHLRFFTKKTGVKLITKAGFRIEKIVSTGLGFYFRLFPTLFAFQFVYVAKKS